MRKTFKTLAFLLILFSTKSLAQSNLINFTNEIKNYDYSTIFTADSFLVETGLEKVSRPEFLGFFGPDYQRFYIHFISVIKNYKDPYEYFVYGRTMLRNNICDFQGKIRITNAETLNKSEVPDYKRGSVEGSYLFFEDQKQKGSGVFEGTFGSSFLIDKKGNLLYDAIAISADGFSNNEFIGTWSKYGSKTKITCNWGEWRIPESGDLDIGAGEFSINKKYTNNGWQSYIIVYGYDSSFSKEEIKRAEAAENKEWWK
jgi:hypothetical protein